MLQDLSDGIHSEVDCARVRTWAESTLPEIHLKLVDRLRELGLGERPLLTEVPLPNQRVFYTRRERVWSMVRMSIPESRLPIMEVTVFGFTSDCGIKICFDRWLSHSCHESHFSLVLEPRREHRMAVVGVKSVNSPFNKDIISPEEIADTLRARFMASLSMCGALPSAQADRMFG